MYKTEQEIHEQHVALQQTKAWFAQNHSSLAAFFAANPAQRFVMLGSGSGYMLAKSAADLLPGIDSAINAFAAQLDDLQVDGHYRSYNRVTAAQRQLIADKAKALAAALDGIDPALGLSGLK